MNRIVPCLLPVLLLCAKVALAADPEIVLSPQDEVFQRGICAIASIPGPHLSTGQIELGAAVTRDDPNRKVAWVGIDTDETSLKSSGEMYARELELALGVKHRFPAPCDATEAVPLVITVRVTTKKGSLGIVAVDGVVRTLPAPVRDEKAARLATVKLANELVKAQLRPVWVRDPQNPKAQTRSLTSRWSAAADSL